MQTIHIRRGPGVYHINAWDLGLFEPPEWCPMAQYPATMKPSRVLTTLAELTPGKEIELVS